jgi:hypothetical protein
MTKKQPRIYTYKITFEEVPHYYYGSHKEKKFGEEYWGSPVAHKWMWDFYTPKKQVLELFDFSDEGYKEAGKVENRLIRPVYNEDPLCLNENCGGVPSLEACSKGGKIGGRIGGKISKENKLGLFALSIEELTEARRKGAKIVGENHKKNGTGVCGLTFEQRSEHGKKQGQKHKENGTGIFKMTPEQKIEACKKGGQVAYANSCGIHKMSSEEKSIAGRKGGKIAGKRHKENGTGFFNVSPEQKSENSKKGAKNTNSQKWQCTKTGFVSTSGALSRYQRKRGIDTSNRIRIE